ncbi:tetratricopeptide repeat protein [soil metagenome]
MISQALRNTPARLRTAGLTVALALPLMVAAGSASAQAAASRNQPQLSPEQAQQALMFQLMMSELALQRGIPDAAYRSYLQLAQDTGDPRMARRAAEIALSQRAAVQTLDAVRLWIKLDPLDADANSTLTQLLVETGKLSEAEAILAANISASADKAEAVDAVQRLLLRAPDKVEALATLTRLADPYKNLAMVRLSLARAASAANDTDRAIAEARVALKRDPASETIVLTAAQLIARKSTSEAADVLGDFVKKHPKSSEARLGYARALALDGQYAPAATALQPLLDAEPDNLDALFTRASIAIGAKDEKGAEVALTRYLAASDKAEAAEVDTPEGTSQLMGLRNDQRSAAVFMLAQLAEDAQRLDDAIAVLRRVDSDDTQYLQAQSRIARDLARQGKLADARAMLAALPNESPADRAQIAAAEAAILREARQYDEAFSVLDKAVTASPDIPDLLYDYAMAAEKVNKLPEMEKALRRVIELRPADAQSYNALGYSLADRGQRLDEARVLIEKAVSLAPDDAFIRDSMGWVQYRVCNYPAAIATLQQAYAQRPDAEIAAHLGEVLWVAGQRDEAEKLWRVARERDPSNETLVETLARLQIRI